MKFTQTLLLTTLLLISTLSHSALINEFQSNPPGSDPTQQTIEFIGEASTSFSGFLISIENDGSVIGEIKRVATINGTFDENGLFTQLINDLENPSFTLMLVESLGSEPLGPLEKGSDIDTNDDGIIDNGIVDIFGTIYDAIGITDSRTDFANLYAEQVGGVNFGFTGGNGEPELVFRDGLTQQWYAVSKLDEDKVVDQVGEEISIDLFNNQPNATSFGQVNPTIIPDIKDIPIDAIPASAPAGIYLFLFAILTLVMRRFVK